MANKDLVISVKGVSKKFCRDLKRSLYYGMNDMFASAEKRKGRALRKQEFWAVRDVNFELRRGQCLGLIGHNGAGKSTLLKMLNGIIAPDEGVITIYGRTAALIELGAGFNPILTGRENIYNNGAVLGFSRAEIEKKIEEIIDFSEIRDFIDTPVQNYSSGMKVRLGFAVASNLDPDLMLIDEVLAVGDVGFRIKCYNKIAKLIETSAIIFVSHSMPQLAKISNHIILMNSGQVEYNDSRVAEGIEAYYALFPTQSKSEFGSGLEVMDFLINGQAARGEEINCVHGDTLRVSFSFIAKNDVPRMRVGVQFLDKDMKLVATCFSSYLEAEQDKETMAHLTFSKNEFSLGKFGIGLVFQAYDENDVLIEVLKRIEGIGSLNMSGLEIFSPASFQLIADWTTEA